jgi:hypothetical protein
MLLKMLLLSLMLLAIPEANNDFVPSDIAKSVALGCMISGVGDLTPFVESQVFVKFSKDTKGWDFKPVMSRRETIDGGSLKAIDDCVDWYKAVKENIKAAKKAQEASK